MATTSLSDIFTSIANAIRSKRGQSSSTKYKPEDMAAGIQAISTGTDISDTTAVAGDVRSGKYFYTSSGTKTQGTLSPGTDVSDTTASASDVKSGKYFYNSSGVKTAGSMNSYTDTTQYLNAGQVYNISTGFHGGGSVIANSLSSQTQATAGASDIKSGKTAWVNGSRVTGNVPTYGEWVADQRLVAIGVDNDHYAYIPPGYYAQGVKIQAGNGNIEQEFIYEEWEMSGDVFG